MASNTNELHFVTSSTPVSTEYPPPYGSAMHGGSSVPYENIGVYPPSPPPSYHSSTMPSWSNGSSPTRHTATQSATIANSNSPSWLKIGLAVVGGLVGGLLLGAFAGVKKSDSSDDEAD